jgi:hypothetical protein
VPHFLKIPLQQYEPPGIRVAENFPMSFGSIQWTRREVDHVCQQGSLYERVIQLFSVFCNNGHIQHGQKGVWLNSRREPLSRMIEL